MFGSNSFLFGQEFFGCYQWVGGISSG